MERSFSFFAQSVRSYLLASIWKLIFAFVRELYERLGIS